MHLRPQRHRIRPVEPATYRLVVVDRGLDEADLAGWWDGLAQVRRNVMLRWAYLDAWRDAFMPSDAALWIPVVLAGGEPVAALPLYRRRGVLHSLAGAAHSDVFDGGWSPDHPAAVDVLLPAVLRRRLRLEHLDGSSPLLAGLRAAGPPMIVDPEQSPVMVLPPTPDALLAGLSSKFRASVRRAVRALDGLGDVTFDECRGGDAAAVTAFGALVDLERSGWKGADGTAIASRPDTLRFYRRLAVQGPLRRSSRIAVLRLDGRVVAAQLDLEQAGVRHGLKMASVDDLPRNQSPGTVLLWSVLRDCIARGVSTLALGGEIDHWKRRWTATTVERARVRTWPSTSVGQLTYGARAQLKPMVRPLLRRVTGG